MSEAPQASYQPAYQAANQALLLERYQRLIQMSLDLASTLRLDVLLNRIVNAAAELCHAEAASILLFDQTKQQLFFDAASNMDEPLMRGLIVPVESSLAGWIVTHREPIIIQDAQSDPRHFGRIAKLTNVTTTSLMGVPMIAKEKVIGVLETINKLEGEFTPEDQSLLMALGAQAALAIENSRLFQQSDLISEMVHELRTPLTSINTATQLLLDPRTSDEKRNNMLRVILAETKRLTEMATAFLDLARLESGRAQFRAQVFEVVPLLEECARLIGDQAKAENINLLIKVNDNLPPLKADRDKIKQVLINLLSNAIKYNRRGGKVTLEAEAVGEELTLSVHDTGIGIPKGEIEHVFEKFYRVPGTEKVSYGTGLGLSICKQIVEAHQGRIEASSEAGEGSSFRVILPIR